LAAFDANDDPVSIYHGYAATSEQGDVSAQYNPYSEITTVFYFGTVLGDNVIFPAYITPFVWQNSGGEEIVDPVVLNTYVMGI
jgi:hypothetical protein